jgi:hypothetical protein
MRTGVLLLLSGLMIVLATASVAAQESRRARYLRHRQDAQQFRSEARSHMRAGRVVAHARSLCQHRTSKAEAARAKVERWRALEQRLRSRARLHHGEHAARLIRRADRLAAKQRRLSDVIGRHQQVTSRLADAIGRLPRQRTTVGGQIVDLWRGVTVDAMGLARDRMKTSLDRFVPNFTVKRTSGGLALERLELGYRGPQPTVRGWSDISRTMAALQRVAHARGGTRGVVDASFDLAGGVTDLAQRTLYDALQPTAPSFSWKPGQSFEYRSGTRAPPVQTKGPRGFVETSTALTKPRLQLENGAITYTGGGPAR